VQTETATKQGGKQELFHGQVMFCLWIREVARKLEKFLTFMQPFLFFLLFGMKFGN
jgi:hypothetical protein